MRSSPSAPGAQELADTSRAHCCAHEDTSMHLVPSHLSPKSRHLSKKVHFRSHRLMKGLMGTQPAKTCIHSLCCTVAEGFRRGTLAVSYPTAPPGLSPHPLRGRGLPRPPGGRGLCTPFISFSHLSSCSTYSSYAASILQNILREATGPSCFYRKVLYQRHQDIHLRGLGVRKRHLQGHHPNPGPPVNSRRH